MGKSSFQHVCAQTMRKALAGDTGVHNVQDNLLLKFNSKLVSA